MKVTFIGTSAGEGYPGIWCKCENCEKARRLGGRNLRGNTCAMIDDDTLIDLNAHFPYMAPRLGIDPARLRVLLVTHTHIDHFIPEWLSRRGMTPELEGLSDEEKRKRVSPCFTPLPTLTVVGNRYVREKLYGVKGLMTHPETYRLQYRPVTDGVEMAFGDLKVTPIRSRHTNIRGFAHNYIIERGGKTLLYASDCGGYDEDMMDAVLSKQYDCVIMEGTFGLGASIDGHMSLEKIRKMKALFDAKGVWKRGSNLHLTHICPHWSPVHDEYEPMLAAEGISLAYDGKVIEF